MNAFGLRVDYTLIALLLTAAASGCSGSTDDAVESLIGDTGAPSTVKLAASTIPEPSTTSPTTTTLAVAAQPASTTTEVNSKGDANLTGSTTSTTGVPSRVSSTSSVAPRVPGKQTGSTKGGDKEWTITTVEPFCYWNQTCPVGFRGKIVDNGIVDMSGARISGSTGATVENCGDRSTRSIKYWYKYENGSETIRSLSWDGGLRHVSRDKEGNYAVWLVISNFEVEGPYTRCTFSFINNGL